MSTHNKIFLIFRWIRGPRPHFSFPVLKLMANAIPRRIVNPRIVEPHTRGAISRKSREGMGKRRTQLNINKMSSSCNVTSSGTVSMKTSREWRQILLFFSHRPWNGRIGGPPQSSRHLSYIYLRQFSCVYSIPRRSHKYSPGIYSRWNILMLNTV